MDETERKREVGHRRTGLELRTIVVRWESAIGPAKAMARAGYVKIAYSWPGTPIKQETPKPNAIAAAERSGGVVKRLSNKNVPHPRATTRIGPRRPIALE